MPVLELSTILKSPIIYMYTFCLRKSLITYIIVLHHILFQKSFPLLKSMEKQIADSESGGQEKQGT